ncbi:hypothetical protein CJ030_MR7G008167 [Morella rubra]|uniref:Uncharacterized protein n=1 Tax=Morella rubra TaxID=262757 RepID=A0A6A1V4Z4_9ROSI|nr:hypothetical protein CJ030_MR7G008167 [Morella rubra]
MRAGTGLSSHEKEPADSVMTIERRMEYLSGWPVAKERPVTLSNFDDLLYEEHTLYQLFEYWRFLHQLSWMESFRVNTHVHNFFCALVSADRALEVQMKVRGVQFHLLGEVIGGGDGASTAFEGECTVKMLRNKSVVAHMANVSKQLEEIKKTLDDFKTEADPQRIPGDIPNNMTIFCDDVRH